MGGTGDPPVPSGHWPDGMEPPLTWPRSHQTNRTSFSIPRGGSPRGTGGSPVLPVRFAAANAEFGLNSQKRLFYWIKPSLERVKGIEPSSQPWEGHILPLNHTRVLNALIF